VRHDARGDRGETKGLASGPVGRWIPITRWERERLVGCLSFVAGTGQAAHGARRRGREILGGFTLPARPRAGIKLLRVAGFCFFAAAVAGCVWLGA
jgi:hypothetical protein